MTIMSPWRLWLIKDHPTLYRMQKEPVVLADFAGPSSLGRDRDQTAISEALIAAAGRRRLLPHRERPVFF
jgi:hypothetical protein